MSILTPVSAGSAGPSEAGSVSEAHGPSDARLLLPWSSLSADVPGALSSPGSPRHTQPALLLGQPSRQGPSDAARAACNSQWPHTDLSFYTTGGPEATPESRSFLISQTAVSSGSRYCSPSSINTPPHVCLGARHASCVNMLTEGLYTWALTRSSGRAL